MFIAVVLNTSAIFAIVATLLWKQFITNRKKRQQRIQSLSSRLPKLQESSPQTLEERRLKIIRLCNQLSHHDKHLGVTKVNIEENNSQLPKISIQEPPAASEQPKETESIENPGDGYESLELQDPITHNDSPEPNPDPPAEEISREIFSTSSISVNEPPSLLPVPPKGDNSQPPGLLQIDHNNPYGLKRGYSVLATFLKKKKDKKSLKAYNIFTGSSSDVSVDAISSPSRSDLSEEEDMLETESSSVRSESVQELELPSLSSSLLESKKSLDPYKYINKQPQSFKKLKCYKNPYAELEDNSSPPSVERREVKNEPEEEEDVVNESSEDKDNENGYEVINADDFNQAPYATAPFKDMDQTNRHPESLHRKRNSTEIKRKQTIYKTVASSSDSVSTTTELTKSESPYVDDEKPNIQPRKRKRSYTTEGMLRISEERLRNRDIVPVGDDAFDHLLDGVDLHDWNERFQRIMTTIRKFNTNTTIALQIKANRALIHLAQDFIYASSTYGKIIISEVYSAEKTIKPINLGGKLGGTKYIVQNILFKFAVDESGLYSDYAAAKVAGHELKGLINYFNCNIEDLCLPLMSLVDYRGFRLIAMSILPIRGSETIIYGSDNYGETIHNKNPTMQKLLKKAANMMNIKEHRCGVNIETSNSLCSPADLEGHLGTDRRLYLLDFSRVLPPEYPVKGIQNAHLYRLLRPEHVKLFSTPLCSDAFSGFIAKFNFREDNIEVKQATEKLINETIPQFAGDLTNMMLEARDKGSLESFRLTEAIHRQGINVRYIGLLRKHIKELDPRTFLLVEMSARVVKNKLRKVLRKKMKELKVPLEEPYRRLVISYLNLVLGDSEASEDYWNNNLKKSLQRTFVGGLSEQESNEAYSLKSSLNNFSNDRVDGKLLLFLRLQKMTGLRFTNRINEEFTQNPNNWAPRGAQPLDETDLEDIGLRVKHMNIISHAQGFVLQMKGAMAWAHDPIAAERFYNMAITKYEEALDTNPNDYQALIRCAEIATQFIEGHARGVAAMKYNIEMPRVQYANMLYQRAVTANPNDSYGLYRYAQFLDKCNIPRTAEEMFLRSLEADPENVACLQEYGNFLSENSQHDIAELFFVRGSELAQKYSTNTDQNIPSFT